MLENAECSCASVFLAMSSQPTGVRAKWKKLFLNYIKVCPNNTIIKNNVSILIHCLGLEWFEVYQGLPELGAEEAWGLMNWKYI